MIRLVALYNRPADEAAFLDRYERVHTPLVKAIPNLRDLKVSRVTHKFSGEPALFMMAELIFDDQPSFAQAMCSRENRAAAADLKTFAADLVTLVVVEDQ